MENSAHTWRLKIFKLFFVYAHRLFCYPPAQKKFFARAKNFFLSPQSSGSRTGGYLLSCPTLCKHWRVDFFSQPPFSSNFSIPAALAAHRYSWTRMLDADQWYHSSNSNFNDFIKNPEIFLKVSRCLKNVF